MMVGVSKKGGEDLHPGRSGLSVSVLQCSFHTSLAVNGIFPKFRSGIRIPLQMDLEEPQERVVGKEESNAECQELPALQWSGLILLLSSPGLLNKLTANFTLQLGMCQADLQSALRQRDMVVDGGGVHHSIDKELAGLKQLNGLCLQGF